MIRYNGSPSLVDRAMLPSVLVADTLDELRAMLPAGLLQWERTPIGVASLVGR